MMERGVEIIAGNTMLVHIVDPSTDETAAKDRYVHTLVPGACTDSLSCHSKRDIWTAAGEGRTVNREYWQLYAGGRDRGEDRNAAAEAPMVTGCQKRSRSGGRIPRDCPPEKTKPGNRRRWKRQLPSEVKFRRRIKERRWMS